MIVPAIARWMFDDGYRPDGPGTPGLDNGIEVRALSARHGRRVVLDDIGGGFRPGSLTAIVGPNGAGKSTLLHILAGLTRPYRGAVVCPARARRRLAFLPQHSTPDLDFPVTVGELVGLGLWRQFGAFRAPPAPAAARIAAAVEAVGLTRAIGRRVSELSAGQRRRAFFARLLLQDAEVLLLDEPFAAVDEPTVEVLLTLIAQWHQERRTMVAVVHDIDQVRAHFPATLILARTAIAWGETRDVLTGANLARAVAG